MSSRRNDESVKLPAALTGLSLAISIAREATDAVPVVKQTMGAAVRILALAEKIDKDREALHALADRSLQLAQRVKDILDGRTPDEKILASFERINRAFDGIEAFMMKHTRRTRLLRVVGYVFTVPLHVERLSRELGDAVQELVLVALLDVNQEAREMHALVAENARYVGEFRLLRHCDVDKLKLLRYQSDRGRSMRVQYYQARVDGQLAVVRYFEEGESQHSSIVPGTRQALYERTIAHDRIMKELSTIQKSHRNIARIYVWSQGSERDRFTVFKSGSHIVYHMFDKLPDPVTACLHWDALHHLNLMGIAWKLPGFTCYMVDDYLEPMIGIENGLCPLKPDHDKLDTLKHILWVTGPTYFCGLWNMGKNVRKASGATIVPYLEEALEFRIAVRKAGFPYGRTLNHNVTKILLRGLEDDVLNIKSGPEIWAWANILLALDGTYGHRIKGRRLFDYKAPDSGQDVTECA